MEHALLKSLLTKSFYDETRGAKCPDKIFSKDLRKIKQVIDKAMEEYQRDITPEELEALYFTENPTLTTAQKHAMHLEFKKIRANTPMGADVAQKVISNLFRQLVGEEVANLGFQYVNGEQSTMEPLRQILDSYQDDFTPQIRVNYVDNSIDNLLNKAANNTKWRFNIPSLFNSVQGLDNGMLFVIGARSNVGKSSFHSTLCATPHGWASQGARILILCNEEKPERVASRYMTAATGMTMTQIAADKSQAHRLYDPIKENLKFVDATGKTMRWAESVIKTHKPDIVVLDIGSKFAEDGASTQDPAVLKANAVYARNIGKMYGCLVVYCTQLSAEAEGKIVLSQAMIEGSKTGLAGESDLMILIARNPPLQDSTDGDDGQRHLNIVKNKINGIHRIIHAEFDYSTGVYFS
jgi:DnaB-like helicase C terminal domain